MHEDEAFEGFSHLCENKLPTDDVAQMDVHLPIQG